MTPEPGFNFLPCHFSLEPWKSTETLWTSISSAVQRGQNYNAFTSENSAYMIGWWEQDTTLSTKVEWLIVRAFPVARVFHVVWWWLGRGSENQRPGCCLALLPPGCVVLACLTCLCTRVSSVEALWAPLPFHCEDSTIIPGQLHNS